MTRATFEQQFVAEARAWVGVPYLMNGRSRSQGVDCGTLLTIVYDTLNFPIPKEAYVVCQPNWQLHTSSDDYLVTLRVHCREVQRAEMKIGDIICFRPGALSPSGIRHVSHAGLYVGGGQFVHALMGQGVIESRLETRIWDGCYAAGLRPHAVLNLLGEA